MIYKIDNKYYIKVSGNFVEVELVYSDNDVDLKPTKNKLEYNKNIKFEEINFLQSKDRLLKEKNKKSSDEKPKSEFNLNNNRSNRKYSK